MFEDILRSKELNDFRYEWPQADAEALDETKSDAEELDEIGAEAEKVDETWSGPTEG